MNGQQQTTAQAGGAGATAPAAGNQNAGGAAGAADVENAIKSLTSQFESLKKQLDDMPGLVTRLVSKHTKEPSTPSASGGQTANDTNDGDGQKPRLTLAELQKKQQEASEQVTALSNKLKAEEAAKKDALKRDAIRSALAAIRFVEGATEDAFRLFSDAVREDENGMLFVESTDKFGVKSKLSLSDAARTFFSNKPWMVAASNVRGGTGATGNTSFMQSPANLKFEDFQNDPVRRNELRKSDPQLYERLRQDWAARKGMGSFVPNAIGQHVNQVAEGAEKA